MIRVSGKKTCHFAAAGPDNECSPNSSSDELQIRGSLARGLIIGGVFYALALIWVYISLFKSHDPAIWPMVGVLLAVGTSVCWGIGGVAVKVCGGVLSYRVPFNRTKSIGLDEIGALSIETGERNYRDHFRPVSRLVLVPTRGSHAKRIDIALGPLSWRDVNSLVALITARTGLEVSR